MSLLKNIKALKKPATRDDSSPWPSDGVASHDSSFVARCVGLMDSAPEKTRAGGELVHVSSLISKDWCSRAHLINLVHQNSGFQNVLPQMRIVWALGRAAEAHVRKQFALAHGRHRMIGNWRCDCGTTTMEGHGSNSLKCRVCEQPVAHYGELLLQDNDNGIVGSPDLVFETEDGLTVVEVKSIKKDSFTELTAPLMDHVIQCYGYVRHLRKVVDKPVRGKVFYVAKDYVSPKLSPYKEYAISDYEENAEKIYSVLREDVREMRKAAAAGGYPARLAECSSPLSTRAKACTACTLCFSL